jgi:isopenicillin-N N-acyltransferase-like protein
MEPACFEQADARERGRAHGALWRAEIRELAAIRLDLTRRRSQFATDDQVLAAAALHLPVLAREAPDLHLELLGIADGSDLGPERIVVLNHYTDLRDVPASVLGADAAPVEESAEGGCTGISRHGLHGPILGQTWDMHATAEPFVRMIRVKPEGSDAEALCFTLTGCLGMAGLGHAGVAVTINNLTTTDGRVGLVWPALVRKMLAQGSAAEARAVLERTPLSSGHYYVIADGRDFFGFECSGELKVLTQKGARAAHLHTNHCFDPVMRQREAVSRKSTTFHRLNMATTLYAQRRPSSVAELWELLSSHDGHPGSICQHMDEHDNDPDASRTCGRLVMRLQTGELRVGRGCGRPGTALELKMDRYAPPRS